MSTHVYVAASEHAAGKSGIALGLVAALASQVHRVGVFRPVVASRTDSDPVLDLLLSQLATPMDRAAAIGVTYSDIHDDRDTAMETIVARFHAAAAERDAMVIVGSDFSGVPSPTEFGFNAELAPARRSGPRPPCRSRRRRHGTPESSAWSPIASPVILRWPPRRSRAQVTAC